MTWQIAFNRLVIEFDVDDLNFEIISLMAAIIVVCGFFAMNYFRSNHTLKQIMFFGGGKILAEIEKRSAYGKLRAKLILYLPMFKSQAIRKITFI